MISQHLGFGAKIQIGGKLENILQCGRGRLKA